MLIASTRQRWSLSRENIECLSRARKNLGVRLSVVSSHQKDCWSVSLPLHRCKKESSTAFTQMTAPKIYAEPEAGQRCRRTTAPRYSPTRVSSINSGLCIDLQHSREPDGLRAGQRRSAVAMPSVYLHDVFGSLRCSRPRPDELLAHREISRRAASDPNRP
jgi:hypothetical protein